MKKKNHEAKINRAEKESRRIQNYSYLGYRWSEQYNQPEALNDIYRAFNSTTAEYIFIYYS